VSGYSVFIPVFNEAEIMEANLLRLLAHLETLGRPFEILVGSNGSNDATAAIGRRLARSLEPVRFFHLHRRAPGWAFREGARRAGYETIITQDMDLSVDLGFISAALDLMSRADLVIGSKKMGRQHRSFVRVAGSGTFILLARLLLKLGYQDYSLAAKAYHRSLVRRFEAWIGPGTSYVLNLIYLARREGFSIREVPVFCRDERESRFNLAREGLHRFAGLGQLWLRVRLGRGGPWPEGLDLNTEGGLQ